MFGRKNAAVRISTILGKGSEFHGDIAIEGAARVDGKVDGSVYATGMVIVGSDGYIGGELKAESVVIGGEVLGNVTACTKTELTATGKVMGDITTRIIVIDEHAVFQGKCDMNQEIAAVSIEKEKEQMRQKAAAQTAIPAAEPVRREPVVKPVPRKSAKAALAAALREVREEADREKENADRENSSPIGSAIAE